MLQQPLFLARDMSLQLSIAFVNWFTLLKHQLYLAFKFPTDPLIGQRALQCLAPPILSVIASLLILGLIISKPHFFYTPLFKLFRLLPLLLLVFVVVGFGLVAKPAVWDHRCNIQSFDIRPSNRPQWENIWKEINPRQSDEALWQYRARMDAELDAWEKRELHEDDLEDWVNLSAQAVAKKNCLDEKSTIFRDSFHTVRKDVQKRVGPAWPTKSIQDWKNRILMDCEICKPIPKKRSAWSSMVMTARRAAGSSG